MESQLSLIFCFDVLVLLTQTFVLLAQTCVTLAWEARLLSHPGRW